MALEKPASAYTWAKPTTVAIIAMSPKSVLVSRRVRMASWTRPTTVTTTVESVVHLTPRTALCRREPPSGAGNRSLSVASQPVEDA